MDALRRPCAGSILTLVASAPVIGKAGLLLACFSLGAAVPMMAIAYGGQVVTTRLRQVARRARGVQLVFGCLVILTAIAMYFQYDSVVTVWLSNLYPKQT